MIKFNNIKYLNTTVKLDNSAFSNCKFKDCTLEYSGSGLVSLVECEFDNVKWLFTGSAKNTLQFLSALYHGMGEQGKTLIERTFDNIKKYGGES